MSPSDGYSEPERTGDAEPVPEQLHFPEVMRITWKAPIPPPGMMAQYAEVDNSYPDRIFALTEREVVMAEREQAHRHSMDIREQEHKHEIERQKVNVISASVKRGQFGIVGISLSLVLLAGYLAWMEASPWLVGSTGFGAVFSPAFYALWGHMQPGRDSNSTEVRKDGGNSDRN